MGLSVAPASAQLREQLDQLQQRINPAQAPDQYRDRRDQYRGPPPDYADRRHRTVVLEVLPGASRTVGATTCAPA